jgi:glycosyltransferase involved in cell wall biosynthesis
LGYLREAIDSVVNQSYQNWEFCIADDCSTDPNVKAVLEGAARTDSRIKLIVRNENGHISKASNSALEMATGEYIALLDHDDRLDRDALLLVALEINNHPNANIIYSDEDKMSEEEGYCQPYYKGDFNYDLFLSHNMVSHLGVYRHDLLKEIGGFRVGFEGSQDYDLALRCLEKSEIEQVRHIPTVLYHWRSYEGSTALLHTEKDYALAAAGRAIRDHLNRTGQEKAELIELSTQGAHRVRYPLPQEKPLVSIIVVVDSDQLMLQKNLLNLIDINNYPSAEIIVACYSNDANMVQFTIGGFLGSRYPVHMVSAAGGWPVLINAAVDSAKGEIIAVLTSSIEVIDENWLSEMVRHALRPQVGVVGVRMLREDDSVQHAGLILRPDDFPGFPMQGPQGDHPGYFGRALLQQNYTAISPACFVFRYKHFQDVGGLNDSTYSTPMAAIDFYLKLREKSYWHTWTPFAEVRINKKGDYPFDVLNDAQKTDFETLKVSWNAWFEADPAYNPNLSLSNLYTAFAEKPRRIKC